MGNKVVGHYRKVPTTVGLRNVIAHNCRESLYDAEGNLLSEAKLPEYISHSERAPMNEGDRCGALAVHKRRAERLASVRLPHKIQDNAAVAIEEFRYSSSNFLGGNVGLEILQDELYERVGKSRGLERGVRGSRARHTDQYSWAAKLARDREDLELKAAKLAAKGQELVQREAQAEYLKRFHARALEIIRGEAPPIIDRTKASLLLAGLDKSGFDELYARALPLADEIRGRHPTRSASPDVGDGTRPSKPARDKGHDDYER